VSRIRTEDGLSLEARWDDAVDPAVGVVVFCHPHPLDGGSMDNPLMQKVTEVLTGSGLHVLRFNFRGVGESEGGWERGTGEVEDVGGAVTAARYAFDELPLGLAGWSFGASTALAWQAHTGSTMPWAGIAPGIRSYRGSTPPDPEALEPADRLVVTGDRDQFASVEEMRSYAAAMDARVELLEGSDHFFWFREDRVGALVAAHFGGRITTPD
jgi:alpha/beta superfamily hydrolase